MSSDCASQRKATLRMLSGYFWPTIKKEISSCVRSCSSCQKNKIEKHAKAQLQPISTPERKFSFINVDIVGPINLANSGKDGLLSVIDRTTGWTKTFPIRLSRGKTSDSSMRVDKPIRDSRSNNFRSRSSICQQGLDRDRKTPRHQSDSNNGAPSASKWKSRKTSSLIKEHSTLQTN